MIKWVAVVEYKTIKQWPEDERPRERLLRYGSGHLSDAQLLAIILRTGGHGISALGLARELLSRFDSLRAVEEASSAELGKIKGMGTAKTAQLKASFELGKRLLSEKKEKGKPLLNSKDVYEYYSPRLYGLKREVFICSFLDAKNRVFKDSTISEGTLTSSLIHPREVFREAIREAAASVIFIHNHPSGEPNPSKDDISITKRLYDAGRIVGIEVIDHIIIGDGDYVSMKEKGFLL